MRGKLIVFEGIEGSGKTTQIQHLRQWLEHTLLSSGPSDYPTGVIVTRQPGGTSIGQEIRQILLQSSKNAESLTSRTELLLYAADRTQHVERILIPALETGHLVLCDRYTASTVAYQGYGRQLDLNLINNLNAIATGGLTSDLTLWLKLDVMQGLKRIANRGEADRIEQAGVEFHRRVHKGFSIQAEGDEFVTVDASLNPEAVAEQIQAIVSKYLQQWYAF
ncbi:dTMP kinase [Leptolyngbyaceae cyanobacterium CCMR0082]|uniref:Thymidylate kinase n=2 Tax=Adonisia turfae TaxID=2950184 RepID=A0A6M0SCE2_9CYAN|nr:dTMP kinase [Adonisia turfae]MDV3352541.1 dTMP kinase [Leptothoe sp. LEGE 181152]NEZ59814.1 dTMP kinase [Adonisia turfae CCMR0081]NEZ66137.1 dTMP kinase [Adonisia turfae CCMR0082]